MADEKILLQINLDVAQLNKQAEDAARALELLREAQKNNKRETVEQEIAFNKTKAEISRYQKQLTDATKAMSINDQQNKASKGSITDLRNQLAASTIAWNNLSKEQRDNAAVGGKIQAQTRALSDELKKLESSVGDNRRNVGNYTQSFGEALKSTGLWSNKIDEARNIIVGFSSAFTSANAAFTGWIGKQTAASAATQANTVVQAENVTVTGAATESEIGFFAAKERATAGEVANTAAKEANATATAAQATTTEAVTVATTGASVATRIFSAALIATGIGAIVVLLGSLVAYFTQTETGSTKLANAMAYLKGFIKPVEEAFINLGEGIVNIVGYIADFTAKIADLVLPKKVTDAAAKVFQQSEEAAQKALALAARKKKFDDQEIENINKIGDIILDIAELREQASETADKAEKKRYLDAAMAKVKERAAIEVNAAIENAAIIEQQNKLKATADLRDEDKRKEAEAILKISQLQAAAKNEERSIQKQLTAINQSDIEKLNKAKEDAAKADEERRKAELEAEKQLRDLLLSNLKDAKEKETQTILNAAQDAYDKLAENDKINEETRANLHAAILTDTNNKIAALNKKYSDEELQRRIKASQDAIENEIKATREGEDFILNLRIQSLELQQQAELAKVIENTTTTEQEKLNIRNKFRQLEIEAEEEAERKSIQQVINNNADRLQTDLIYLQLKAQQGIDTETEKNQKLLEVAQNKYNQDLLDAGDNYAKQQLAKAEFEKAKLDIETQALELQQQNLQTELEAYASLANSLAGLMEIFGANNEKNAGFTKALALFQIAMDTAAGVSAAVAKGAAAGTFPANIAAIAAGVAAVVAGIAKAKQTLTAQPPKSPQLKKFDDGGNIAFDGGYIPRDGGMIVGRPHGAGGVKFAMGNAVGEADGRKGEAYIINTRHDPYIRAAASSLNVMGGGKKFAKGGIVRFDDGGFAANSVSATVVNETLQGAVIADLLKQLPAPVVTVEDINLGQARTVKVQSKGTI